MAGLRMVRTLARGELGLRGISYLVRYASTFSVRLSNFGRSLISSTPAFFHYKVANSIGAGGSVGWISHRLPKSSLVRGPKSQRSGETSSPTQCEQCDQCELSAISAISANSANLGNCRKCQHIVN
ncbi:hypothetical protein CLIB1423_30S00496 [[Candida] railenensis]|uniref:Uncharacterized protein n=1 Tax=[Candida] railenensis TaxID=45579 RepID=A0A9P0W128_9ASCO|nr:hypothetical protein CLIB1423_30S00496 [[Candida] railenensis]